MKIKILTNYPGSACAFYRSVGVLQHLRRIDPMFSVELVDRANWISLGDADIVFMERPQDEKFVEAIRYCKSIGIPVWSDFDDDLFNLEKDNPGFKFYSSKRTQANLEFCIKVSDVVTVSTPLIAEAFSKINPNTHVIPNAHNDYFFPFTERAERKNSITWRGSNTHRLDLMEYSDAIWKLGQSYKDHQFHFLGKDLWFITDKIENAYEHGELDLIEYFHSLKAIAPKVHLVPLKDNRFNRCKSNIAWMEATWAGAACVVPDMPEFLMEGLCYVDNQSFYAVAKGLLDDQGLNQGIYESARRYIEENLLLSRVNKIRIQIARELNQ